MSHVLEARSITLGYAGVPVIKDVDLAVRPGEIVTVLGANGAGKTTLLLGLAGALPLMEGEVEFDGSRLSPRLSTNARRGLGLLTDDRAIFRNLSVRDNLKLGRGDVERAMDSFPALERLAGRTAGLLSGGEQQMLGLGRIIAARPKLLLADELSLGLAPLVVSSLLDAVRKLADDGTAVILVEQHVRLVLGIADRAVVLHRGAVAIEAPAAELLADEDRITRAYLHTTDAPEQEPGASGTSPAVPSHLAGT
jgi:branched-chain amino acid transport system ATP-binding protein